MEQLTEELHSYRHRFHYLDSITPMELFADDRETLLERLVSGMMIIVSVVASYLYVLR